MDALPLMEPKALIGRQPVYVLYGSEDFMKWHLRKKIEREILGDVEPEYALTTFIGEELEFSTLQNELNSVSFFSEIRLVIVEQAEDFIAKCRPQLERYLKEPSSVGVLVLDAKTLPSNTNLYKKLPDEAKLQCQTPKEPALVAWCIDWAKSTYQKKLERSAAQLLVHFVGTMMGLLDSELKKIADFIGARTEITVDDVNELAGKTRELSVFKVMDAIADGKSAEAIDIIVELLTRGESPIKLLAGLSFQLRRLAKVARLVKQGMNLEDAMTKAGVAAVRFIRDAHHKQLRQLGMARLEQLYDWLVELDFGIKGGDELPEHVQIERFIVRLARPKAS